MSSCGLHDVVFEEVPVANADNVTRAPEAQWLRAFDGSNGLS